MDLKVFENEQFGTVRTLTMDGEIYFVGKDVASALGYKKARNAIAMHVDAEDKKDAPIQGDLGGVQTMTIINESGLYSLILSSKLPQAKSFKHWVTAEVLPAIRKNGYYASPNVAPSILDIATKDIGHVAKNLQDVFGVGRGIALAHSINLVEKFYQVNLDGIQQLQPPTENTVPYFNATEIGKQIGIKARTVNQRLLLRGLLTKSDNGKYILTDKGRQYAESFPFSRNGHSDYQIKWIAEVVDVIG